LLAAGATFSTFFGTGFGYSFLITIGIGIFSFLIGYGNLGSYFLTGNGKGLLYKTYSFLISLVTFMG